MKEFYCIVAPQRSGTTVLQRTLESGQQIKSFYEIFHANIGDNQSRYFYFLRTSEERMRRQCQPSRAAMRTQLKDFLDYLASLTPLEKIFLDVKQNSLHHLDVFWQQPISMPFFLTCANALGIKFIRLKRENLFLQALSTLVALSRNRWQLRRGSPPVEDTPIRINPRQTLGRMCVIKENNDLVDRWLQDVREVLWLSYESLFEGEHLAFEPAREIAEFCGLADTLAEIELPLEKTIPDPRSMISNYDEVLNFFKGRQFEELVVKGLG